MNHKKLVIMGIRVGLIVGFAAMAWELPLQDVGHPDCKGVHRQELSNDCKIALDAPMEQSMSELLVSVLRGASYNDNHTPGSGSHPSTDFATNMGTPVYSMGDGEVINARYRAGYGNSVTVRHSLNSGENIYSNYSHLSVIDVKQGQRIEQGMKVGEVGRSGFTMGPYGYHLDFQITTSQSPSHPYGFHDCKQGGYLEVVQEGLCKEKLEAYTMDPLEFFATYANKDIRPVGWKSTDKIKNDKKSVVWVENDQVQDVLDIAIKKDAISSIAKSDVSISEDSKEDLEDTVVIVSGDESQTVVVRESIQEHGSAIEDATTQGTLSLKPGFDISWEVLGNTTAIGQIIPVKFDITQDDEPLSGKLDERITISGSELMQTLPGSFSRVYKGTKTIFLRASESGTYRLDVRSGEIQLGQIVVTIN